MDLLPGPQLSEAEATELAGPPSLLSRFGQGLANQPADIFNHLSRLAFNLGLQDEEKPVQIGGIFDIPEPTKTSEWLTDMGASAVGFIPLAAAGEGIAGLGAEALNLGKTATTVAKSVGGFEAFSETPEDFATNALTGAAFGVVGPKVAQMFRKEKALSPEIKAAMAEASAKVENADLKFPSKGTPAASEALLPTRGSQVDVTFPRGDTYAPPTAEMSAREMILNQPYVHKSAEESADAILLAEREGRPGRLHDSEQAVAHQEARLDNDGRLLRLRLRRESGVVPPEGSLIRNPLFSEEEAMAVPRMSVLSPNELATRAAGTIDRTPPVGSLIREPRFSAGEALSASELRTRNANKLGLLPTEGEVATLQQQVEPARLPIPPEAPVPPIAPRPPEPAKIRPPRAPKDYGTRIEGPALLDAEGETALIEGKIGDTHADLGAKATEQWKAGKITDDQFFAITEALDNDAQHGFHTNSKAVVDRTQGATIAVAANQAPPGTKSLHSQTLRDHALLSKPKVESPKMTKAELKQPKPVKTPKPKAKTELPKAKPPAEIEAEVVAPPTAKESRAAALAETLEDHMLNEDKKGVIAAIKKAEKEGLISKNTADEARRISRDRDMGASDVADDSGALSELRDYKDKVATLQQEPKTGKTVKQQKRAAKKAAEPPIPSSSLEKVRVPMGDGEFAEGVVMLHDPQLGLSKVKVNGEILDVWTHKLEPVEAAGGGNFVSKDSTQIGGLNQFAKLEEEARRVKTGMKLKIKPGEAGFTQPEVVNKIAVVAGAMAIGGAAGATLSDDDKRMAMAITFAVGAGILGHNLPAIIEAFTRSHPAVGRAGSVPAKFKVMAQFAMQAGKNAGKVAEEASADYAGASGSERMIRWLNRQMGGDAVAKADIIQAVDRSRGVITDLTETIEKGFNTLAQHKLTPVQNDLVNDLIRGHIDYATFNRDIGHAGIQQAVTGIHESITAMQDIFADSLAESELKNTVRNKLGKYVTEAYKLFTIPEHLPTEVERINAALEMNYPGATLQTKIDMLKAYEHEVKLGFKMYGAKSSTGVGATLGSDILKKNDKIGPAFKAYLGIYDDPIQKLAATAEKLTRASATAEMFNQLAALEHANGLKYVYSVAEKDAARLSLEQQIAKARTAGMVDEVATLQQKMKSLDNYQYNPKNAQHGKLSDTFVDRHVFDRLKTFDSVMHSNSSGMIRAMTDITNAIKLGKTVASPLQLTRQIVTMPLLGLMNGTHPGDWKKAYNAIYNNPDLRRRLTQIGLMSGDSIKGMLQEDFSAMLKGRLDKLVTNSAIKRGWKNWQELYRAPDLIVRVAGFLKEEERLLLKYGTNQAERAEREAINFANRYSMNYGAVPPIVKTIRRLPFVNQFLTFAYETARITKNLGEDAVLRKDPYAIGVLTAFATTPFIIQHLTESQLSPEDKRQWDMAKGLGPSYSRSNFKFVTGKDKQGNFHYIDFTPLLLHDKWLKMMRDIGSKDSAAFFADNPVFGWQNTPLLNIAANLITGTDIHTQKKLDTVGRTLDSIRRDVMPPLLGTDLDKLVAALTPNAEGGLGIRDMQTGQANTIGGILGSYATSLRPYSVAPSYLIQRAISDAQDQTANARAYLYRVSRSNATLQQKSQALAEYQTVQKQVIMSLRDKLRVATPSQESSAQ